MKQLLAIGLFAFTIGTGAIAQDKKKDKTPEQKAEHRTERLSKELSLTADQATTIKALLLQQDMEVQAIKSKHANDADKAALKQEIRSSRENGEASLKKVLTADQLKKYEELKAKNKEKKAKNHSHKSKQK